MLGRLPDFHSAWLGPGFGICARSGCRRDLNPHLVVLQLYRVKTLRGIRLGQTLARATIKLPAMQRTGNNVPLYLPVAERPPGMWTGVIHGDKAIRCMDERQLQG